jgi:heme-degrading monooxygenase HmoA
MPKLMEMDETVTLQRQMEEEVGPVILVNRFSVAPQEADDLLRAWSADAEVMKRQPGFISTQLHRGIAGSGQFLNYAVWQSVEHFKRAFFNPEFRAKLTDYPPSTVASPHLFQKVGVPGICLA